MSVPDEILADISADSAVSHGTGLDVTGPDAQRAIRLLGEAYRAAVLFQAERDQLLVDVETERIQVNVEAGETERIEAALAAVTVERDRLRDELARFADIANDLGGVMTERDQLRLELDDWQELTHSLMAESVAEVAERVRELIAERDRLRAVAVAAHMVLAVIGSTPDNRAYRIGRQDEIAVLREKLAALVISGHIGDDAGSGERLDEYRKGEGDRPPASTQRAVAFDDDSGSIGGQDQESP